MDGPPLATDGVSKNFSNKNSFEVRKFEVYVSKCKIWVGESLCYRELATNGLKRSEMGDFSFFLRFIEKCD